MHLDAIDRRLRMLGREVFDGGHWIKVRDPRGREGWLPAAEIREVWRTPEQTELSHEPLP